MNQKYKKDQFLESIKEKEMYCPTDWTRFFQYVLSMAESKCGGEVSRRLPNPLILGGAIGNPTEKHRRLSEQLDWAIEHQCFDEALRFLTRLPDDKWEKCELAKWDDIHPLVTDS